MRRKPSYLTIAAALAAAACSAAALAGGEAGKLELRDLGSRFVGYTTASAASGSLDVLNPLFVQYLLPARKRHEYPIVFIHGGGGQGTDWLETPDGRDGWVDYFAADGWDVYVVDRPGHGRAQSNSTCGNTVRVGNSGIIARLSTSAPNVWPGGEPTPTNDAVVAWTASSATAPYCGDALAAEKISALLDEIGPAVLLAHSAGGGSTFRVPELNPAKVVGIIGFEAALAAWKPLLRRGGVLALTEPVWLKPDPPAGVRACWEEYPAIEDVPSARRRALAYGYDIAGDFVLSDAAWWTNYYGPLETRLEAAAARLAGVPGAAPVLAEIRDEIECRRAHPEYYGYLFLVLRA